MGLCAIIKFFNRRSRNCDTRIREHAHNCFEIICFNHGRGNITIKDITYPFYDNYYAVVKPETEHWEYHGSEGQMMFLGFDCPNTDFMPQEGIYFDDGNILELVSSIIDEGVSQQYGYEIILQSKINELIVRLARSNHRNFKKCKSFSYIVDYINENYHQKISFRELASVSGYNYDYFRHIFKSKVGVSPQEYLIERRMLKAKELLDNTHMRCTEICLVSGFSNSAQFSVMFKKKYGVSPTEYRK